MNWLWFVDTVFVWTHAKGTNGFVSINFAPENSKNKKKKITRMSKGREKKTTYNGSRFNEEK